MPLWQRHDATALAGGLGRGTGRQQVRRRLVRPGDYPGALRVAGPFNEIHEVSSCFAIGLVLENDVESRSGAKSLQQGPEREPLTAVFGQPEIHRHTFYAGVESFRRDRCQIWSAEVPADLIVEIHRR